MNILIDILSNEKVIIFLFSFIFLISIYIIYEIFFFKIHRFNIMSEIPKIIKLAQRIEIIKNEIDLIHEIYYKNIPINSNILIDTKLSKPQIFLLAFIKELEKLNTMWETYYMSDIINTNNIIIPNEIAYHIRELLGIPINNEKDTVWLSKDENECLKKYKNIKTLLLTNQNTSICIKCKEIIKNDNSKEDVNANLNDGVDVNANTNADADAKANSKEKDI